MRRAPFFVWLLLFGTPFAASAQDALDRVEAEVDAEDGVDRPLISSRRMITTTSHRGSVLRGIRAATGRPRSEAATVLPIMAPYSIPWPILAGTSHTIPSI